MRLANRRAVPAHGVVGDKSDLTKQDHAVATIGVVGSVSVGLLGDVAVVVLIVGLFAFRAWVSGRTLDD